MSTGQTVAVPMPRSTVGGLVSSRNGLAATLRLPLIRSLPVHAMRGGFAAAGFQPSRKLGRTRLAFRLGVTVKCQQRQCRSAPKKVQKPCSTRRSPTPVSGCWLWFQVRAAPSDVVPTTSGTARRCRSSLMSGRTPMIRGGLFFLTCLLSRSWRVRRERAGHNSHLLFW